jgi:hypothetical protein
MAHWLYEKLKIFMKRLREPNFCEPTLHIFPPEFCFEVYIFNSSQIPRKPVTIGSKVTSALVIILISKLKFELIQINCLLM